MKIFVSNSPCQTMEFAQELSNELVAGQVVAFRGDLGAGKTCFTKGLAKGLGYTGEVISPTFALINEYIGGRLPIYHFDMYRISSWDELYSSGYFEYIESGGVLACEWSENIENALPENTLYVEIQKISQEGRKICVYRKGECDTD